MFVKNGWIRTSEILFSKRSGCSLLEQYWSNWMMVITPIACSMVVTVVTVIRVELTAPVMDVVRDRD